MNKRIKSVIFAIMICIASCAGASRAEAAVPALNISKCTLYTGDSYTLKLKNATGKITYSTSDKKVASVNSKGKISAGSRGTAVITAKYKGKTYTCKVTVRNYYDKMYDYIMKNGKKNSHGYREVSVESGNRIYSIVYNTDTKKFEFKFISEDTVAMYGVTSCLGRYGSVKFNTDFMYLKNTTGTYYFGTAPIVRAKYSVSYKIPLKISESDGGAKSVYMNNAGIIMRRAMYSWNSLLKSKLGVDMNKLGFKEY